MNTTITQQQLDSIAEWLDDTAREAAHAACVDTPADFAGEYLHSLARVLGEEGAKQCRSGEVWAPDDWLPVDGIFVRDHAEWLGVKLTPADWRALWEDYTRAG